LSRSVSTSRAPRTGARLESGIAGSLVGQDDILVGNPPLCGVGRVSLGPVPAPEGRVPLGRRMPSCPTKGPLALRTSRLRCLPICG
jgi:hypothetical protein